MVINIQKNLKQIATLLDVKLDDTKNAIPNSGVTTKIFKLLNSSKSRLGPSDSIETLQIKQWIEYVLVYASNIDNTQNAKIVLRELNDTLAEKTYLVGYRLTIADVLLFYVLKNVMASLTNLEKEKYLNVCRWFDNIQNDSLLRQKNKPIDFSSNYLSTLVPARH